ncbi:hypothetical protein A3J19_05500 [Candidatus Daviesbacteria bacterium RIFCSPLOWO2_02_FULL_41_8]|uniref:Uncharacterized protein n=3 Tax=Candidatus Daviesiibacteriota TaxID=1752718 RepID=A0A1F5NI43_9BACT|nr:MAG: hypothetical protein A2871_03605 [Candidatus Daviesbacteria bacterium RIFCSPHIGHO2_01_FULL_41_23]OGE32485.1 MAG: hypothetical protein A3D83_02450 [Candidatus Daviesbacteria bacterium RIFCSPHIGHO2_02_FULL_41_10]OGE62006.1 MAG: hypothetical protein A2967_03420 [Candidatus Daviesbacteria bacterium RIFCSPLOWO2_01_FULL_41_32]OGE77366.1 MAG: hypothetical protein A3J19_05500 [Candidatus Daviesbacteria bacterium RIFCSPLOWO2_02_FULL_41_8]
MIKKVFILFSLLLLIYMLWPGPGKIADFAPLPSSVKSTLAGDNIEQVSNVAAYFSDNYRGFVVPYYSKIYQSLSHLPFPPMRLNHPPEYSWNVIKKHTDSTYMEELVYPLRDSLYVNGFEPFYEDGSLKFWGSTKFTEGSSPDLWYTKATIRYYPAGTTVKFLVWGGIIFSIYWLFRLGKRIFI